MSARGGGLLHGVVTSGVGLATGFTELEWAAGQFSARLGFRPWPGTFNLRLRREKDLLLWRRVVARQGLVIEPPSYVAACLSSCYRVLVAERVRGAIILPHVAGYPEDQIEVLAVEHLRSYLGVGDGDTVALRFPEPELD